MLQQIENTEMANYLQNLSTTKVPGYDLITPKVPKELSDVSFRFITYIFNAILRTLKFYQTMESG